MRLLKIPHDGLRTAFPKLVDFPPDRIPVYAILSHRWGAPSDELLYDDLNAQHVNRGGSLEAKKGYGKLLYSCKQALEDGLEYLWVSFHFTDILILCDPIVC